MLSLLICLIVIAFGLSLVKSFNFDLFLKEKISLGIILGIEISSIIFFLVALLFGLNALSILLALILMAIFIMANFLKKGTLNFSHFHYKNLFHDKYLTFLVIFWVTLFGKIFFQQFVFEDGNLFAGWIGSFGDGSLHLSLIHSFAYGDNFFPKNPIFSGYKLSYPFLSDFYSAVLLKSGLPIGVATGLPATALLTAYVVLLYSLFIRVTKSKLISFIAIFISIFIGGLGFWQLIDDVVKSGSIIETLKFFPHEYTHLEDKGIKLINIVSSALVPQRAFIFGLPMFLSIYLILRVGIEKMQKRYFIIAALLTSALPFLHAHTLIALSIVVLTTALLNLTKDFPSQLKSKIGLWFIFGLICLTLILPQFILFYPHSDSSIIRFQIGWSSNGENLILFWFKNTGFLPLLTLLGFLIAKKEKMKEFLFYYLPFLMVFVISNIVLYQPNDFDNSKVFYYGYIFSSPIAAYAIVAFLKYKNLRMIGISLFILTIASGALDIYRLTNYQRNKIMTFDTKAINVANFIIEHTPPKSIFVTADYSNHPVPALAGRTILMGYPGWLWSYAIDFGQREKDIREIYSNSERSKELLSFYKVNYVFIGPVEKERYKINQSFFEDNFPIIYSDNDFQIFTVNELY